MWAAGVILFSLATGTLPFRGSSVDELLQQMERPKQEMYEYFIMLPRFAALDN